LGGLLQRQDLVERLLVSDQIGLLQVGPCGEERGVVDSKPAADSLVGVIAQPLDVRDGDQKEIESQIGAIAAVDVVLSDEPVVDPVKPGGHLANSIRSDQMFFHELRL
jgi:hypothetical protein